MSGVPKHLPIAEISVLSPYVSFFERRGKNVAYLLDQHGLSLDLLELGNGKISKFQGYQFLQQSARDEGLMDLGFRVGEIQGLDAVGSFRGSVRRSTTLHDAVQRLDTLFSSWVGDNRLWLELDGNDVWLLNASSDGLGGYREIANQCGVMILVSLVREFAGAGWRPKRVRLGVESSHWLNSFDALHEAEAEFTEDLIGVQFPATFLSRGVQDPKDATPEPVRKCLPSSFSDSLEEILRSRIQVGPPPTAAKVSEMIGLSKRTLHRRLNEDGLSFQSILDRVRFELARQRLKEDPSVGTWDLSRELHFSSASGFVRAFRRIAGVTPGVYARQIVRGQVGDN